VDGTPSSGALLRVARTSAGLSQADLGRRAHIAQSVVSAYESGRREPALSTLRRLVAATGHQLVMELEPDPDARPGLPDTPRGRRLRQRRKPLLAAAARFGASNLRVFGSVARGEDTPDSDVDLLVDLAPGTGLVAVGSLERELSQVLGSRVHLAPVDSLRHPVSEEAERDAVPL
jgi:uncharacterized protein